MKRIVWEDSKTQSKAYNEIMKIFNVSKASVSYAMNFKRNSNQAIKMRNIALKQFSARLLSDEKSEATHIKEIDCQGNIKRIII